MYAHCKRDGWRVSIHNREAHTTRPTNITAHVAGYRWFENLAQISATVEGELWYPGKPASYISTALIAQDSALKFSAFAIPSIDPMATLETAHDLCTIWGVDFCPYHTLGAEWSVSDLLGRCTGDVEGYVLKVANYHGWYKIKPVKTVDLVVTGFTDGEGKYLGLVGSLRCSTSEGYEVAAVSGMTDEQRLDVTGADLGRVVEVRYQYVGSRGRLRHPTFVRWRDDKNVKECHVSQDSELERIWKK